MTSKVVNEQTTACLLLKPNKYIIIILCDPKTVREKKMNGGTVNKIKKTLSFADGVFQSVKQTR